MSMMSIRAATPRDREAIRLVEEHAFGQQAEAGLVDALVTGGDAVVELVAEEDGQVVGHILFSRLYVQNGGKRFAAVALAPLAVEPSFHGTGIGGALILEAHVRLKEAGETLAVVLGDPTYYGRFGYSHARAARFDSEYQGEALQALAWGDAPETGRLVYASAFTALAA
ncbi:MULTISPECIES: N-acetyltransferase [unclassified Mesorhizobium]|jgi:putative acetyltransferase|uniref:GNAT family N-acetyltransferase n=1 Tax=unclassified Mesorhizobium TaxID=325217 RepID=UPI000FE2F0C9|nr:MULTISPECIES: N-acetyltransferase [unclassified Mesorhizobium]MDG4897040.1 N-acetyltransferase [Mesorhizobium sp. WSM4976]RWH69120.1 MAG: N-acetyltransferase [Mesorhizobium sp.]RWL26271.1 MAG: N-acetyltransferase [Mesorhizobium sp.]RWL26893.1 MAG: N-acetyltransferase [Mesorhizobium sp.]RWL38018.1 MAG: N-acetyltransferase [Mesorhizobium sp.]